MVDTKYTLEDITSPKHQYFPIWKVIEKPGMAIVTLDVSITRKKPPIVLGGLMNRLKENEIEQVAYNVVGPDDSFFSKVHLACGLHQGTNFNLANLSERYGLSYAFVGLDWERAQKTDFMLTQGLFQRGKPIQDHSYQTIDEAIDVFDMVNSQGTKLTDAELVLTHITGVWSQARRVMKKKIQQMQDVGFEFNLDLFSRFMVVTLTNSALFKKNAKLKYDSFEKSDYTQAWEKISKALDYLIPILQQDGLISSTNDLNTNNVLVPMVAFLVENENKFTGKLKYQFLHWMFQALIWSRYSGQTDQRLDKDVHIIYNRTDFIVGLLNEIKDQRGRLEVKPADLEGRGSGHALYKMLYVITKANKAIDWSNGGAIYGTIGDYYSIQSHHIFPQAYLYRNGYDSQNHLHKKLVNEIANRAFITRDTNYYISDTSPAEYLPEIQKVFPNALKKQFLPANEENWIAEKYEKFLEERREWIANEINSFLNMLWDHESDNELVEVEDIQSWEKLIGGGESNFVEFKSTLRYCLRQESPQKYIEFSIMKAVNALLNSEGGTLIVGVDDAGEVLGLEYDLSSFGNKGKDGFLLHFDNMISSYLGKEYAADISGRFEVLEEQDIFVLEVNASNKPVFIEKDGAKLFFVRHSASSQPYDMSEAFEYINKHWTK